MEKKKFYMTTAIAYASGKPHIGNTYEVVLADSIARYKRFEGYDVFFQTGTDEHGQKIELKAEEAGVTPKEFVDNAADQPAQSDQCGHKLPAFYQQRDKKGEKYNKHIAEICKRCLKSKQKSFR